MSFADSDPVGAINWDGDVPSREEERELVRRAQNGDEKARWELVERNRPFVVRLAGWIQDGTVPFDDLVSQGQLGLHRAISTYDPHRSARLVSWAAGYIRREMNRLQERFAGPIEYKARTRLTAKHARQMQEEARAERGRALPVDELHRKLVAETGYKGSLERLQAILTQSEHAFSLNQPLEDEADGSLLEAQIGAPPEVERWEEVVIRESVTEDLLGLVERERDRRVLELYTGIGHARPHELSEIGKKLGVSRERARQLRERALSDIRGASETRALEERLAGVFETEAARAERSEVREAAGRSQ